MDDGKQKLGHLVITRIAHPGEDVVWIGRIRVRVLDVFRGRVRLQVTGDTSYETTIGRPGYLGRPADAGDGVWVGRGILVQVSETCWSRVRLRITCPRDIVIAREELLDGDDPRLGAE